jgi:hypothetical protein
MGVGPENLDKVAHIGLALGGGVYLMASDALEASPTRRGGCSTACRPAARSRCRSSARAGRSSTARSSTSSASSG